MEYNLGLRIAQKKIPTIQATKRHEKLKMDETKTCCQITIIMLFIWILSRIEINVEDKNMHRSWEKNKKIEIFM